MSNSDKQLMVEDALAYLERVKTQFGNQPKIYNQFLDIMKNFKSHTIDTPGVIARVSELFKGHNNLILGFNAFLPPGFKITLPAVVEAPPQQKADGQQPEFDVAINYVTKIKKRFSEETGTYRKFLEILHTYQKEQKNIKQVLDEVSYLFRDHPDLLKEFTYFLPEAVQEVAKARLAAAAARSERRLQKQRRDAKKARDVSSVRPVASAGKFGLGGGIKRKRSRLDEDYDDEDYDAEDVVIGVAEAKFFERVKGSLRNRALYNEFLNVLTLHHNNVITTRELYTLTADILGPTSILQVELKKLCAVLGENEDDDSLWFGVPLSGIDYSSCRRCTPSYRALPDKFPPVPCSGRTEELQSMLNDNWVSVPTGSEDSFTFKSMQRNLCEENLWKCEDDRFEVDMVIEATTSTIRTLEPLLEEVNRQKKEGLALLYKIDRRSISVLNLKCISRIYGEHGGEILELLTKNAAGALPVVLARLKQKCAEWRAQRLAMNEQWKNVMAVNYYKSLDHRSLYFPANDKKAISSRQLISEIRAKAYPGINFNPFAKEEIFLNEIVETVFPSRFKPSSEAHLNLEIPDMAIQRDVLGIIKYATQSTLGAIDCGRINKLWSDFLLHFLGYPVHLMESFILPSSITEEKAFRKGSDVVTPYGEGTVVSFKEGYCPVYKIALPFGTAFLNPRDVRLSPSVGGAMEVDDPAAPQEFGYDTSDPEPRSLYGNGTTYVLFRLYKILYDRLLQAKQLVYTTSIFTEDRMVDHPEDKLVGSESNRKKYNSSDEYRNLLIAIHQLIDADIDQTLFESECRRIMGTGGYFLFTFDKVIQQFLKQISAVALDGGNETYQAFRSKSISREDYREEVKSKMFNTSGSASALFRIDFIHGKRLDRDRGGKGASITWSVPPTVSCTFLGQVSSSGKASNKDAVDGLGNDDN